MIGDFDHDTATLPSLFDLVKCYEVVLVVFCHLPGCLASTFLVFENVPECWCDHPWSCCFLYIGFILLFEANDGFLRLNQHFFWPYIKSWTEQLQNASWTVGITFRSFICHTCHEIMRDWPDRETALTFDSLKMGNQIFKNSKTVHSICLLKIVVRLYRAKIPKKVAIIQTFVHLAVYKLWEKRDRRVTASVAW